MSAEYDKKTGHLYVDENTLNDQELMKAFGDAFEFMVDREDYAFRQRQKAERYCRRIAFMSFLTLPFQMIWAFYLGGRELMMKRWNLQKVFCNFLLKKASTADSIVAHTVFAVEMIRASEKP